MQLPEVFINGKSFPISVENSKQVGINDIIMGVENWLYKNKLYLCG